MQKRASFRGWAFLGTGALCCIGAIVLMFGSYEFRLTEEQIKEKLVAVLPIDAIGVQVSDITVDLAATTNSVDLRATGSAEKLGQVYTFTLSAVGVPEYRWTSGEFYFRPTEVTIESIEQTGGVTVEEGIGKLRDFATELFPQREDVIDELAYAGEQLAPEITLWLQSKAEAAAVFVLSRAPIYTLPNDAKGIAAQAVLESVTVDSDSLIVKLSLYRLGTWVLLLGFLTLLSIGIVASGWAPLFIVAGGIITS